MLEKDDVISQLQGPVPDNKYNGLGGSFLDLQHVSTHTNFTGTNERRKEGRKKGNHFIYDFMTLCKNHLDSEKRNPLLPLHGLFFPISSKGSFMCFIPLNG